MTPATFTPIAPRVHPDRYLIIIPAFNEAAAIPELLRELREACPRSDVLVISDGSVDSTAVVARQGGARVLDLPCNLGVGGAVQAGFQYAAQQGYDGVVRIDGDGQHPPRRRLIIKRIGRLPVDQLYKGHRRRPVRARAVADIDL